jgi:signal transduction histidine kinase
MSRIMRGGCHSLLRHWLVCCLLLLGITLAHAKPVVLGSEPVVVLDAGQIQFLRDASQSMALDDAKAAFAQGQFKPLAANLGLGFVPDAVWLHLTISPDQAVARWLEVMPPYLDDIRLFHIAPNGRISERRSGDRLPQASKEEDYRGHLFKLDLQPGQHDLFIRLKTTSTMAAIVKLWQPDAFERQLRSSYFGFGLYFSLIFTVLLFNAVNWLVSRRRIFLIYVGYLLLNVLQWLGINGFVSEFMFPAQPLLANLALGMALSLAGAMAFGFFIMVLELKQHHPVLYRVSLTGLVLGIVTALATPLGYYGMVAPWFLALCIIALCGMPWPTRRLWRTGDLWARLLAAAYVTYGVLISINILGVLAVLPFGEAVDFAGMASNIAHILLLHFAILLNYRRIEVEHAAAMEQSAVARRQAELEKAHREEQDKLLAMNTHEIRTPIAVIDAATQTLEVLDESPSADREERYERIHRSVNRLSVLLDLAVAQTRSEIADWTLTQSLFQPGSLTNEVVKLLGNPLAQRIVISTTEPLPALLGDDRMLRFALLNLLDNACKYSPPDSPVHVYVQVKDGGVMWRVEDSGLGIPPGMEEKIFEKYVRASESAGKAGLGLGLYLARHIVSRHGGTLKVEIGHPNGACFVCWLPARNGSAQP